VEESSSAYYQYICRSRDVGMLLEPVAPTEEEEEEVVVAKDFCRMLIN
jgi:hypothetical protein